MNILSQLEVCAGELTKDVEGLIASYEGGSVESPTQNLIPAGASVKAHEARVSVLANAARLQTLLDGPEDFLQRLALQTQLLACIQWLGEFQVLACIPLTGSVPLSDLADLAGVPEAQLSRIVGMTATAGFLHEPQPGQVSHSALSAPFVTRPSHLDAAMFLAGTAAPAALQMSTATQRFGQSKNPGESAYSLATNTQVGFATAYDNSRKLQRQWPAYLRYGTGDLDSSIVDILMALGRLDALQVSNPSIVEIGARSTDGPAILIDMYPALNYIVQVDAPESAFPSPTTPPTTSSTGPSASRRATSGVIPIFSTGNRRFAPQQQLDPRITVQQRATGLPQAVRDAAIYVLRLTSSLRGSLSDRILTELRAHADVLRAYPSSTLVLVLRLLPNCGGKNSRGSTLARLSDLSLHQLANERLMELSEVMELVHKAGDSIGQLVLVNTASLCSNSETALELRYQARVVG